MALITDAHQIGVSATPANNYTWYQPSVPDGTVRLGQGNAGATTGDTVTITGNNVAFAGTVKSNAGGFVFPDNTTQTTAAATVIPSGSKMPFAQAAAPTGWTQCTSYNDYAIRLVSGTGGGTGGTVAFTTAFSSSNTGATTLSTCQIPSHQHSVTLRCGGSISGGSGAAGYAGSTLTSATGGGGSHTHSLSLGVQYVNFILATKN